MKKYLLLILLATCAYCPGAAPNTGVVACPSSGNQAVLSKSTPTAFFVIQSLVANTGTDIEIGNINVTTSNGLQLLPGQSYAPAGQSNTAVYDLGNTYFACQTNTDHVRYIYY